MPLVNSKELFKKAYDGGYAIGAFNVNDMEIVQAITEAANELRSPVILQVSAGARKYAKHVYLMHLVKAAIEDTNIPIVLHLDHGDSFELCKECIDGGFSSVMIDGSKLPFDENIALTKKVVEYAHAHKPYVTVEGEIGKLAGIEDAVSVKDEDAQFTNPNEVEEFVKRTGVDSLAIAIGTSHGAYKFKPGQKPRLRFDILEEISKRIPNFPIVLHGASSVPQEYVKMVNQYGGKMPDAIGIPEDMLAEASKMAVCKINIDSDLRLAMTGSIRKHLVEHPDHFDPRQYLGDGRTAVKELVKHKIKDVLGSMGKAD
ncbi:MAG: class II fructose-1,6-bisphosphate aldolase [Erysipelotrichaceae bacterium]|nr:class II fructose-1,6-bisphosphate aldolase [Erysipelotrichaceae bacterium]